jgi:hypothetical protein
LERVPEGISLGDLNQGGHRHIGAAPEIVDRGERLIHPCSDDGACGAIRQAMHHAKAQPHGEAVLAISRLQCAIPTRGVDADGPNLDAVVARVLDRTANKQREPAPSLAGRNSVTFGGTKLELRTILPRTWNQQRRHRGTTSKIATTIGLGALGNTSSSPTVVRAPFPGGVRRVRS